MNTQNLQQKNGTLLRLHQKVFIYTKIQLKFLTSLLESSLCDYSDRYVLVTRNIAIVGANNNIKVALKIAHHLENVEQK